MAGSLRSVVCYDPIHGPVELPGDPTRLDEHSPASGLLRIKHWLDLWRLWILPLRCWSPSWWVKLFQLYERLLNYVQQDLSSMHMDQPMSLFLGRLEL